MRRSRSDLVVSQASSNTGPEVGEPAKHTVYFDGACPLCSIETGHYASLDRNNRLNLVDVSDEKADLGEDLAPDAARRRFHVRLTEFMHKARLI